MCFVALLDLRQKNFDESPMIDNILLYKTIFLFIIFFSFNNVDVILMDSLYTILYEI